jgi:hypothetical protein
MIYRQTARAEGFAILYDREVSADAGSEFFMVIGFKTHPRELRLNESQTNNCGCECGEPLKHDT